MRRLLIIISCLMPTVTNAQANLQLQYGYRGGLAASRFFPSTFDLSKKSLSLETNFNLYFSNRAVNFESFRTVLNARELTNEDIDQFLQNLDERNTLTVGQDLLLLALGFKSKIRKLPINWGVTISDRGAAHLIYRKSLFELLLRGNRDFAGQAIELSPELRGRYFREIALHSAFEVKKSGDLKLRVGYQLKYYWAIAGVFLEDASLRFFTEENGRSLSVDYRYDYFSSGIDDFSLTTNRGYGLGLSLGTTLTWKERLALDIGLNDLGSIAFNQGVSVVSDRESFVFEGLSQDGFERITDVTDSIDVLIENENRMEASFHRPVGTQLLAQLSYKFNEFSSKENPTQLFLTYVQGFHEVPGITRKPRFVVAANTRLFKSIYFGLNSAFGGLNSLAIGGSIGVRIGNFRFSIQSDDFTGFILPSRGTGIGLGFTMRYSR